MILSYVALYVKILLSSLDKVKMEMMTSGHVKTSNALGKVYHLGG